MYGVCAYSSGTKIGKPSNFKAFALAGDSLLARQGIQFNSNSSSRLGLSIQGIGIHFAYPFCLRYSCALQPGLSLDTSST
jgi:hypothetical protein